MVFFGMIFYSTYSDYCDNISYKEKIKICKICTSFIYRCNIVLLTVMIVLGIRYGAIVYVQCTDKNLASSSSSTRYGAIVL